MSKTDCQKWPPVPEFAEIVFLILLLVFSVLNCKAATVSSFFTWSLAATLIILIIAGRVVLIWIMRWGHSAFSRHLTSPSKCFVMVVTLSSFAIYNFFFFSFKYMSWWPDVLHLFLRCVTASVSASASMTQQLLSGRVPRPKPFRVTNADRSVKKGIMADTLEDLTNKVRERCEV